MTDACAGGGGRATASGKLRFVYDNRWRMIAEYDQNDVLVNRYVYGPEIDEL